MPSATPTSEKTYEEMTPAEKRAYTLAKKQEPQVDDIAAMFAGEDGAVPTTPGLPRPDDEVGIDHVVDMFAAKKPVVDFDEDKEIIRVQQVPVPVPEIVEIPIPRRGDWVYAGWGDNPPVELAQVMNVKQPGSNYRGRVDLVIHAVNGGLRPIQGAYYALDPRFKERRAMSSQFENPGTWVKAEGTTISRLLDAYRDLLARVEKLEKT